MNEHLHAYSTNSSSILTLNPKDNYSISSYAIIDANLYATTFMNWKNDNVCWTLVLMMMTRNEQVSWVRRSEIWSVSVDFHLVVRRKVVGISDNPFWRTPHRWYRSIRTWSERQTTNCCCFSTRFSHSFITDAGHEAQPIIDVSLWNQK